MRSALRSLELLPPIATAEVPSLISDSGLPL